MTVTMAFAATMAKLSVTMTSLMITKNSNYDDDNSYKKDYDDVISDNCDYNRVTTIMALTTGITMIVAAVPTAVVELPHAVWAGTDLAGLEVAAPCQK